MKKVECIIRAGKFDEVKAALAKVNIHGMTVSKVKGYGRQRGYRDVYMGVEYTIELLPKVKLEFVVDDSAVEEVVDAVCSASRTGLVGDGKIFVYDVVDAVRIRTGERGEAVV